ncbi:hypothetical protein GCM10011487_04150 [Steroidobacter agaridevorans]|uniref:Uncharacterized protein n=1 Tax=Steroidobacter agaridevorans TaxID=2695856 RepID=A0A829Y609_9GAMM|nr:hypothetical protein [Steroidobacter agaridevorans]GFE78415.1 hypothetical protein GCM10011487_04150 [Steroidobacter agaridevorans]
MPTSLVIVKTPYSPEGAIDPLDLDNDPSFKSGDYRALAERIASAIVWSDDEGQGEIGGHAASLIATDACLFINFDDDVATDVVRNLTVQMLELGAVVLDADSAETL